MNAIALLLVSVLQAGPECQFVRKSFDTFTFSVNHSKTIVETFGPSAELLRCQAFEGFPRLVVAEIKLGSTGTTSQITQTNLFVFDVSGAKAKQLFNEELKTEITRYNPEKKKPVTQVIENKYELKRSKTGQALVVLDGKESVLGLSQPKKP